MSEVSSRALELHLRVLEKTQTPLSRFIEGIGVAEDNIRDPKKRISWEHFSLLTDRLEALCGGPDELSALGKETMNSTSLRIFTRMATLVASARNVYWVGHKWAGKALFSNIETEFEVLGPTSVRLSVVIPEPYRECQSFFYLNAGAFAAAPRALGLPDALVTPKIDGRRCDYFIEHAPSMTLWSRLRHAFLALFSQRYIFQELRAQNDELQRQLADLSEARRAAEEASRLKTQFIGNIGHEIRTPMNGVIGLTEILLSGQLSEEDRAHAEMIRTSADALMRVINDVLDFSKIEAGNLQIECRDVDLHEALQKSAADLRAKALAKGLEFSVEVDARVPKWARCDAGRIQQVLLNLGSNAVKFTDKGSVTLIVELESASPTSSTIAFRLTDTGIGINESARERLFTPFVQEDGKMNRRFGGTGLGLAIAKQLVELMGGSIGFESKPGCGATFFFSVPCARASTKRQLPALPLIEPPAPPKPRAPTPVPLVPIVPAAAPRPEVPKIAPRILVVEDNAVNRLVLVRQLEKMGYNVDIAENGKLAVEATEHQEYAAILMDLQMPEMDGFQATAIIRTREQPTHRVPIIAVSAHSEDEFIARALAVGMNAHIAKPIQRAQILEMLDRLLREAAEEAGEASEPIKADSLVIH